MCGDMDNVMEIMASDLSLIIDVAKANLKYVPTVFNVVGYNVKGDGIADDSAKILETVNAAAVNGGIVYFPSPSNAYRISTNFTVPSNVTLWFANGAKLSIDIGITVTINGPIGAGLHQIFSGLGTIGGSPLNPTIYAEWFGVPKTETVDAAPLLQKAITFCQTAQLSLTLPLNSKLLLSTQVVIEHGKNAAIDQSKNLTIYGNGALLLPNLNDYAIYVKPLCLTANKTQGWATANVNISDIQIDNYYGALNGYANCAAVKIGRSGYAFDGFVHSVFKNVLTTGFTAKQPIAIESSRMITFERLFMRASGINISCTTLGDFCGDLEFNSCEFMGSYAARPVDISGYSASGSPIPEVRGIRFNNCIFYGGGSRINVSTNCLVGDIWFNDCAWDAGAAGEDAMYILVNGSAIASQIIIDNPYMVNYTGHAIYAQTDGTSTLEHFHVTNGHFGMIDAPASEGAIRLVSVEQAQIHNNTFTTITGTAAIDLETSAFVSIQGNTVQKSTVSFIATIGAGNTDFMVTGNMGKGGINDLSGAVNKLVANNLTTAT
jgi:hypothetical protein